MQKPDSFVFLANVGFQHEMVALRKYWYFKRFFNKFSIAIF
jgi:hypothetical protein